MDCTQTDIGCIPNDPIGFTTTIYTTGLSIIGGVAVISIIYGGYLMLTSSGNPKQVKQGKNYIVYAIIGLLFAVLNLVFIRVIAVDIFGIPGFN